MYGGEKEGCVCVCVCFYTRGERGVVFVLPVGEGEKQDSVSDVWLCCKGRTFSVTPLCDRRMSGRANLSVSITQTHTKTWSCCVLAARATCVCVFVGACVYVDTHASSALVPIRFKSATFHSLFTTHGELPENVGRGQTSLKNTDHRRFTTSFGRRQCDICVVKQPLCGRFYYSHCICTWTSQWDI